MKLASWLNILAISILALAAAAFSGNWIRDRFFPSQWIETEYQAVLLDNGAAYFGKLERITQVSLILKEVFYVESRTNPETKQVSSILIKRGKEWHAPDRMVISLKHVVFREPVTPGSRVARLIAASTN